MDSDDPRDMWEQSVHEVSIDAVMTIRKVKMTNKTRLEAPELRYNEADLPDYLHSATKRERNNYMADNAQMVLRWIYIMEFQNAFQRRRYLTTASSFDSIVLRPLSESECTVGLGKSPEVMQSEWRKDVTPGPSTADLHGTEYPKYTFFDSCK